MKRGTVSTFTTLLLAALVACGNSSMLDASQPTKTEPTKDAIAKTTENGPVKATVTVWPPKPTLGEPIYLRLAVDAPAGISVDSPFQEAGDQRLGRFKIVGFVRDTQRKADGGQHQEQTYTLEAPTSGKHRVPPLRLEMVDSRGDAGKQAGKPQEILTEEVPIDIAPVKSEDVNAKLHAAAGKLDPDVGGTPWFWIITIAGGALVLVTGSLVMWQLWRARRRIAVKKSAYEEAVTKLRSLELRGAPTADQADSWFVELSAIVRDYLERRYDIRAPELTTEEFLVVASRAPELTAAHRTQLSQFLERCDRVKFAGYRPDSNESIDTLAAARAFVEDTRLREDLPEARAAA
ncbi:MAG TPA: hypothetical protein VIV40_24625 [Kofleriaceae bacterium]